MAAKKNVPQAEIDLAVALHGGDFAGAAKDLGLNRTTVSRRWRGVRGDGQPTAETEAMRPDRLSSDPSPVHVEVPVIEIDYRGSSEHYVYPLGDVHKGAPAHAGDRWREWLEFLERTPRASMLGTGDFLNAALKDSKSEAYDEVLTVGAAKRELRRELAPLASARRLDLLMPGNHEARIYRAVGDDPIEDLADSLGVPYARTNALLNYHVGDQVYRVYVRHGTGGGAGTSIASLMRQSQVVDADIYLSAHVHSQLITRNRFFRFDPATGKMESVRRYFVVSGSFVNYEDYAAERGYTAGDVGAPRMRFDGERKDIHVSL